MGYIGSCKLGHGPENCIEFGKILILVLSIRWEVANQETEKGNEHSHATMRGDFVQHLWMGIWKYSSSKICISFGIYLTEIFAQLSKSIYKDAHWCVVWLVMAKNWSQPNCPSLNGTSIWWNNMSLLKQNEVKLCILTKKDVYHKNKF